MNYWNNHQDISGTLKILVTCAVVWLLSLSCLAQDTADKQNTISLYYGMSYLARQDLVFSPFVHSDLSFMNVGLEYSRDAKFYQKATLRYAGFNAMIADQFDFSVNGENETAYPHNFTIVDLDYLIGKKYKDIGKTSITLGAMFMTDVQAMNYGYGRISSFGYYSAFGLGAFGKGEYAIDEKSNVSAIIRLPIFAWLARSPYLVNDDEFIENTSSHSGFKTFMAFIGDGQLVTWNKFQTFDLEVKYTYQFDDRWALGATYLLEFVHTSIPRNLLSFRNSLNLSANFSF